MPRRSCQRWAGPAGSGTGWGCGPGLTTMTILRLGTIKMQSSRQVMEMLNGLQSVTVAERLWIGNGNWQKGAEWPKAQPTRMQLANLKRVKFNCFGRKGRAGWAHKKSIKRGSGSCLCSCVSVWVFCICISSLSVCPTPTFTAHTYTCKKIPIFLRTLFAVLFKNNSETIEKIISTFC